MAILANHKFRRCLLLWLMTLSLLGVQLVQGSVLHQHTQHSVDCALCHFQLSDDSEFSSPCPLPTISQGSPCLVAVLLVLPTANPSPYQGRAPPEV